MRVWKLQSDSLKHVAAAFMREINWSSWQAGSSQLRQPFTQHKKTPTALDVSRLYSLTVSLHPLFTFIQAQEDILLSFSLPAILFFFLPPLFPIPSVPFMLIFLYLNRKVNINFLSLFISLSLSICLFMSLSLFNISGMQRWAAEGKWLSFPVADFVKWDFLSLHTCQQEAFQPL